MKKVPKPNTWVRIENIWCGCILDVYENTDPVAGDTILEIVFLKNIFKGQFHEYLSWSEIKSNITLATAAQIKAETNMLIVKQTHRLALVMIHAPK